MPYTPDIRFIVLTNVPVEEIGENVVNFDRVSGMFFEVGSPSKKRNLLSNTQSMAGGSQTQQLNCYG